jgi:hypothetical protein
VVVDAATIALVVVTSIVVSAVIAIRAGDRSPEPKGRFDWVPALRVVVGASAVFVALMVYTAYAIFLYLPLLTLIFLICLVILAIDAVRKRTRQSLSMLLTLVALLGASWLLFRNEGTIRPSFRWLLWSRQFKAEVLAQPAPVNGELRHMEWEATGFGGVANNTDYLVFDPTDSLAMAAKRRSAGKFSGVPCEVLGVLRLESHWYSVAFYTDEAWGERNTLDCTAVGR